ncbi:insulinase family protein [Brochothrix thermosphacta]|uniref:insulinase family protein n=1 Tax=Brochothrix thermosphacta TaxID=2756 RepID=UPI00083F5329|nr:insulinase family protein [Brochothrix thermosphacta]ODJ63060.1 peptidase M16 [Brochothrix thermosphacta]
MLDLQLEARYHGFIYQEREEVEEIKSITHVFEHEKTGAKLLYFENDDTNKVFSISFRTPPEDDTGVFHILEHSVLCGSRKYPLKEPFVELVKGSLNTFLNAMTFSDKTMYPVASQNDKDFHNLMDVYLDAVFHPLLTEKQSILKQEGWHYELNSVEEPIEYKGVVYNEMKGVFSSPEQILMRSIQKSLFPDTPYRYESGGDPIAIPELTYDQFVKDYQRFYNASNSFITLAGDLDILEKLAFLDAEYLSEFEKVENTTAIPYQLALGDLHEEVKEYAVLPTESLDNKSFLSLNYVISDIFDAENYFALDVLEYILLESSAAPLKQALLDAKLGNDVFGMYDNGILQPLFSIVIKNANASDKERFQEVVRETLQKLVSEGIDKDLIESAIMLKEFQLREADFGSMPKGLIYSMRAMDSWLYEGKPATHLAYEKTLTAVKQGLHSPYFEKLIDRYFLNSLHQSLVIVEPSHTLAEETNANVTAELNAFKTSLSEQEVADLVVATADLKAQQELVDDEEALKKLPMLTRADLKAEATDYPLSLTKSNDIPVMFYEADTNKIAYIALMFNTSHVAKADVPYLGLLEDLVGQLDTSSYNYSELSNELNIVTGGTSFYNSILSEKAPSEEFQTYFTVKTKILQDEVKNGLAFVTKILKETLFTDKKRITEIVQIIKSRIEMSMNQAGHNIAAARLGSYIEPLSNYSEDIRGLGFYDFICDLTTQLETDFESVQERFTNLLADIISVEALSISVTGDHSIYQEVTQAIEALDLNHSERSNNANRSYELNENSNEGLQTSSKVQYVVKGGKLDNKKYPYNGHITVLKKILSYDYLWNQVRVLGGAYGAGFVMQENGKWLFWSYRDPNLPETLAVYDKVVDYLRTFDASDYEMTKYIIGTMGGMDMPLSPRQEGARAVARHQKSLTVKDIQKTRDEILSTTAEDIREMAQMFADALEDAKICVFGNNEKIQENIDLFDSVRDI